METKVCKTCGLVKELSFFWQLKTGKYGVQAHCIGCAKIRLNHRYIKNREQVLLDSAKYRNTDAGKKSKKRYYQSEKGIERNIRYLKEYRLNEDVRTNRRNNIIHIRERDKQNRINLSCGYVRQIIKTLSGGILMHHEIPDSLMETKRQSLFLKRLLKQKKQKNEQNHTTDI